MFVFVLYRWIAKNPKTWISAAFGQTSDIISQQPRQFVFVWNFVSHVLSPGFGDQSSPPATILRDNFPIIQEGPISRTLPKTNLLLNTIRPFCDVLKFPENRGNNAGKQFCYEFFNKSLDRQILIFPIVKMSAKKCTIWARKMHNMSEKNARYERERVHYMSAKECDLSQKWCTYVLSVFH